MGGLAAYLRVSDESVLETGYNQEGEVGQWVAQQWMDGRANRWMEGCVRLKIQNRRETFIGEYNL